MMRAVILVPAGPDAEQDAQDCIRWCETTGHPVAHVIVGSGWQEAVRICLDGDAELVVMPRRTDIRADWVPQLRVVEEERARAAERRRRRQGKGRRPDVIDR